MAIPALAQQLVWSGPVDSNGQPVSTINLEPTTQYVIRAVGQVYFGRWRENGEDLLNDACYEFNAKGFPDPLPVLENNRGIPICTGGYEPSHAYRSNPFNSLLGGPLTFRIFDTDYRDNNGALTVEVYRVD